MRLGENSAVDFTGLPYNLQVEEYYLRVYDIPNKYPDWPICFPGVLTSKGVKDECKNRNTVASFIAYEWFLAA